MVSQRIRVGVIGLGGMAWHHMNMLSRIPEATITAICDVNPDLLDKVGDQLQVDRRYRDYASIVQDPEVDCLLSVVPNEAHADILELCIRHGKPCMSEKPFTATFAEAERLKELYEASPIPCMVGFSYRYVPAFRYAKHLIEQGELGEIRHITVNYLQQWGAEMFDTPFSWRFSKKMSGSGALGDLGSHMIDAARYFVGEFSQVASLMKTFVPRRKAPGTGEWIDVDVDDFAAFVAEFENGAAGVFTTSRNAVGFGNHLEVTVFGTLSTIQVNCEQPKVVRQRVKRDGIFETDVTTLTVPESFEVSQLQDFLDMVRGERKKDAPDFWDGYQNQLVLDKVIRSFETGQRVSVR